MEKSYCRFKQGHWQGRRRGWEADAANTHVASTQERSWLLQREQAVSLFSYDSIYWDFFFFKQSIFIFYSEFILNLVILVGLRLESRVSLKHIGKTAYH